MRFKIKKKYASWLITSFVFTACQYSDETVPFVLPQRDSFHENEPDTVAKFTHHDRLDSIFLHDYNLVDIRSLDTSISVDIKYATSDNFTGEQLYLHIRRAYLQKDVAERLVACQHYLKTIHPNYSLLIYDAVRPLSVQQKMWDLLDTVPVAQRAKFVSNPRNHSIHNYGCAIDLTIIDEQHIPLDMGSFYDDIRPIAYPRMEDFFLKNGELSREQIANRTLLRRVMKNGRFSNIATEWWHFNACTRQHAKQTYRILIEEPIID